MATSAVILANGGSTYYAVFNVDGKLTESGVPYRPLLSPGLSNALKAHSSSDLGGNAVIYWTAYGAELRSCISLGNGVLGFGSYATSLFQPYDIETVYPVWPEPSDGGAAARPSSPSGLETFAKGAAQVIMDYARQKMSELINPFGAAFQGISDLLSDPAEFIKSSPLMRLTDEFDKAFRQSNAVLPGSGSDGKPVFKLPGEVLDRESPFSGNEVYTPRQSGSAPGAGSGAETESKSDTLERLIGTISDLVQKFISTPDDQRQPGTSIFDKLLPVLDFLSGVDDVLSKLLGIPKQVLSSVSDTAGMLQAISDFLLPLISALGLSNRSDTADSVSAEFDYSAFWAATGISDSGSEYTGFPADLISGMATAGSAPAEVGSIYGYEFWNR